MIGIVHVVEFDENLNHDKNHLNRTLFNTLFDHIYTYENGYDRTGSNPSNLI